MRSLILRGWGVGFPLWFFVVRSIYPFSFPFQTSLFQALFSSVTSSLSTKCARSYCNSDGRLAGQPSSPGLRRSWWVSDRGSRQSPSPANTYVRIPGERQPYPSHPPVRGPRLYKQTQKSGRLSLTPRTARRRQVRRSRVKSADR